MCVQDANTFRPKLVNLFGQYSGYNLQQLATVYW